MKGQEKRNYFHFVKAFFQTIFSASSPACIDTREREGNILLSPLVVVQLPYSSEMLMKYQYWDTSNCCFIKTGV